ncbi:hypothetical protein H6G91_39085 [Nostoc muscorum FACHB-395]|nr:hypothetical protein [Desmonostoc muscorum FACHB-395]
MFDGIGVKVAHSKACTHTTRLKRVIEKKVIVGRLKRDYLRATSYTKRYACGVLVAIAKNN